MVFKIEYQATIICRYSKIFVLSIFEWPVIKTCFTVILVTHFREISQMVTGISTSVRLVVTT